MKDCLQLSNSCVKQFIVAGGPHTWTFLLSRQAISLPERPIRDPIHISLSGGHRSRVMTGRRTRITHQTRHWQVVGRLTDMNKLLMLWFCGITLWAVETRHRSRHIRQNSSYNNHTSFTSVFCVRRQSDQCRNSFAPLTSRFNTVYCNTETIGVQITTSRETDNPPIANINWKERKSIL